MTDSPGTPHPTEAPTPESKVVAILEEIRPYIQSDGGDIEFVSFENGRVSLRLQGACTTCPSSVMTLRMGIENALREQVPEVQEVVHVQ
ncbi:MAG: NifU family protein [Planctomycetota bacterium]|jgi:Fe-S cluster biogenesis protein NfuA